MWMVDLIFSKPDPDQNTILPFENRNQSLLDVFLRIGNNISTLLFTGIYPHKIKWESLHRKSIYTSCRFKWCC